MIFCFCASLKTFPSNRRNTKMGLVLEVTNSYHQGRHGVEIRVNSLSRDGTHLWIRTSDGLNKLVRYLTERARICDNEQHTSNGTGLPLLNRDRNRHQLHCHFQQLRLSRFISENGSMSNWGNTTQKAMKLQRKLVICFDTGLYFEIKMEQLNSGD